MQRQDDIVDVHPMHYQFYVLPILQGPLNKVEFYYLVFYVLI